MLVHYCHRVENFVQNTLDVSKGRSAADVPSIQHGPLPTAYCLPLSPNQAAKRGLGQDEQREPLLNTASCIFKSDNKMILYSKCWFLSSIANEYTCIRFQLMRIRAPIPILTVFFLFFYVLF